MHTWLANQNTSLHLLHISHSYNYNVKGGAVSDRFGGSEKGGGGIGDGRGRSRVQEIFKEEGRQER